MQQYRLNYTLLIGLIVGTLVASGAVYGLWRFQIERKSSVLLDEAEKARQAGNLKDAVRFYSYYISIHGGEDDTRVKLAETFADRLEQDDVEPEEWGAGIRMLEATVAQLPEASGVQRRLVDLYGRLRRYQDALDHLGYMLARDEANGELQALKATFMVLSGNTDEAAMYSYQLIGYDPTKDTFDETKATAPHDADVYSNLANILRTKLQQPELADRVMDQLIKVNPDSAAAYLSRGVYWLAGEDPEKAREDIEKAYELDPNDAGVLLVMADQAAKDEQVEKAVELLDTCKKLHPGDSRAYQSLAELKAREQKYEEALAEIDEGLKTLGVQKGAMLLFYKADLQFRNNDLKRMQDTIGEMKRANFRTEFVEWYESQILVAEGKWFEASVALNKLRPRVADLGELPVRIDTFLGLCYEKLGKLELAQRAYEEVLKRDPKNEPAIAALQRLKAMGGYEPDDEDMDSFQQILNAELEKPKEKRDWPKIEKMAQQFAEEQKFDDVHLKLLQAQLAMFKEDFAAARKLLAEAYKLKPDDLRIHRSLIQVTLADPKAGPTKAMEIWETVTKQLGDGPALRLDKVNILAAMHDNDAEKMRPELVELTTGIDDWTTDQKVGLWGGLAARYLNLGMPDEAQRYLSLVADNRPNDLPTRLSLFSIALESNDDPGMEEAQKKILQIVKDKNDSSYLFTEARRRLSQLRRGQLEADAIPGIRQLVRDALAQRPDWHELHLLSADLELAAGNAELALQHLKKAEEAGRPHPRAVALHIRLLTAFGQYGRAGELLERIPKQSRQALLGNLYTDILFRNNKVTDAIREALASTEADPKNAQKQFWYGQLLARSVQLPDLTEAQRNSAASQAIAALRRAVELEPELQDAWYALITLNAQQQDIDAAQQALRDAQLSLSGDNLLLFLAKSYEALGRPFDAETMYRAVYEVDPKDVRRVQQLAAFYLGPLYRGPDRGSKVAPLLNQILRAGEEVDANGKKVLAPNDPNLLWARREGAKLLAATQDYQNLVKAEKLLASSSQDGVLSIEDRLQMAQLLARRPEPESRLRAIRLLEEVRELQPLSEQAELALGQLYFATDDWPKCRPQMQKTIGAFPNSVAARDAYASMLLSRNDPRAYEDATEQLDQLSKLAPNSKATFVLTVKLAGKRGKQKEVTRDLRSRLPNVTDPKQITDEQAERMGFLASLLIELGDLDTAEKTFRQLVERDPQRVFGLATFLGTHRDVGQCFELLEKVYTPENVQEVLTVGVNVLRARRSDVGDKFDAQMEAWLNRGLRDNPDSISLQMLQADLYDVEKKFDQAVAIYNKLLARDDFTGIRRAIVLNNLSFLIALAGSAANTDVDPLKLVEEAEKILGPNADILDTKAVVLIERKQYQDAIDELKLSVTDNPTGAKYFHLVVAHLGTGENAAALDAWGKAEAAGLTRDELNRLEHDRYDQVKAKIDQLRAGNAAVTPPAGARKAG